MNQEFPPEIDGSNIDNNALMSGPMWQMSYKKRLLQDLEQWTAKGWITSENAEEIRATLPLTPHFARLPVLLGILGAVLLCFAAMSFVAANWQDIPRLVRLAMLLITMWAAYGVAIWLHRSSYPLFFEAAIIVAVGLFGANIMLIAQMYHIDRSPSNGVMLWAIGALLTSLLAGSRAALIFAFALICLWSGLDAIHNIPIFQWQFIPLWLLASLITARMDWRPGYHLMILTLFFWLAVNMALISDWLSWHRINGGVLLSELALIFFVLGTLPAQQKLKLSSVGSLLGIYGLVALLILLFVLQVSDIQGYIKRGTFQIDNIWMYSLGLLLSALVIGIATSVTRGSMTKSDGLICLITGVAVPAYYILYYTYGLTLNQLVMSWSYALAFLLFCVWAAGWGQRHHSRTIVTIALITFGAEVLYIYFETLGSLLDTSLFFLIGGLLLIGLGVLLHKIHQRLTLQEQASEALS